VCAVLSAGLVLLLFGVCVLLTALTRDLAASFSGVLPVGALLFAALGLVIARRQPRNAIGWLLVASGLLSLLFSAAELYAVLAYRTHPGALPAGRVAVFAEAGSFLIAVLCGLAILLFPDGRLPSRRWRSVLWAYLAASAMFMANEFIGQSTVFTVRHLRVDVTGAPVNNPDPAGFLAHADRVTGTALLVIVALWACFVARQAVSYRRATGERRQQLKWLMTGGALCVVGILVTIQAGNYSSASLAARVALAAGVLAIAALPVSIGVAILKYRLYDIDRIISRTLAYAIGHRHRYCAVARRLVNSARVGGSAPGRSQARAATAIASSTMPASSPGWHRPSRAGDCRPCQLSEASSPAVKASPAPTVSATVTAGAGRCSAGSWARNTSAPFAPSVTMTTVAPSRSQSRATSGTVRSG
jgi:hypothetical protein